MSLIDYSKQRWKLNLFIMLMGIGAGVTLFQFIIDDPLGKELTTQLVIVAMVMIVTTFCWAGQSLVCPKCKLKLLYYSITKVGLGTWYIWLLSEERCPECGYPEDSNQGISATRRQKKKR